MGFGGASPPAVTQAPPPPTTSDADVQAAQTAQAQLLAKQKGYAASILTSGQGVTGAPPALGTKTLLGG
jgi:hypothetical protein